MLPSSDTSAFATTCGEDGGGGGSRAWPNSKKEWAGSKHAGPRLDSFLSDAFMDGWVEGWGLPYLHPLRARGFLRVRNEIRPRLQPPTDQNTVV